MEPADIEELERLRKVEQPDRPFVQLPMPMPKEELGDNNSQKNKIQRGVIIIPL